jgi:predicted esterase
MNTWLFLCIACLVGIAYATQEYDKAYATYQDMRKHLGELYEQEKFEEAAELLLWAREKFPDYLFNNSYNLALMYVRSGQYEKGIDALQYALNRGLWFALYFFEPEPWTPLREQEGFQAIRDQCEALKQEAQKKAKPDLLVVTPEDFEPKKTYPLFITLHGGSENIEIFKDRWKSQKMLKEFIIAYPQSSQVMSMDGYWWHGDVELAKREIADAYHTVIKEYPVDSENVIIGGFSSGGVAALEVLLSNAIPIHGFIVLCPDWPESFTAERIRDMKNRGIRGTLVTNEMDERLPLHEKMVETFKAEGLPHQFIVTPNIGHWYPEDLDGKIDQAIDHIRQVGIIEQQEPE